jgi:hypothetical protein
MNRSASFSLLCAAIVLGARTTSAHFKLFEPTSWIIEDDRGDPQKTGPCGGSNFDWGKPSYVINKAIGGQKLHLKIQETIYHPGHYRVALAVNSPTELPPDPKVMTTDTDKGPRSVSAEIETPPKAPVLADGLFVHATRPSTCPPAGICSVPGFWEADVQLPNVTCKKCTLQIAQFMAEHAFNNPGGYTYHHCADIQITADPSKPLDKGWPAER